MAKKKDSNKKPSAKLILKKQRRTVSGFSRFLYAMNLILEVAAARSKHKLKRNETLLLSIFRNGNDQPYSLQDVDAEFRKLLAVSSENVAATKALRESVAGLVDKKLLKSLTRGTAVQITPKGQAELKK